MPTSEPITPTPEIWQLPEPSFSKLLGEYRRNLIDEGIPAEEAREIVFDAAKCLHTGDLSVGHTR